MLRSRRELSCSGPLGRPSSHAGGVEEGSAFRTPALHPSPPGLAPGGLEVGFCRGSPAPVPRAEGCTAHPRRCPEPGLPSPHPGRQPHLRADHVPSLQESPPASRPVLLVPRPPASHSPPLSHASPSPQVSTCGSAPRATPAAPARWRRTWPTAAGPSWRRRSWTVAGPCRPRWPPSCGALTVRGSGAAGHSRRGAGHLGTSRSEAGSEGT